MSAQAPPLRGTEVETWAGLIRAHASITRRFNAELVAEHGLTLSAYEVLLRLAHAPDRRMRRVDLSEEVLLTPSGITRLLAGLEESGFVERASCASDARVTYAQLTDSGFAKLREAAGTHVAGIRGVFSARFSLEEMTTLRDLLQRLPLEDATDDVSCEP